MYAPVLKNFRPAYRYRVGDLMLLVVTDCESVGLIHYRHVLYAFRINEPQPIFAVAAEINSISAQTHPDRLFLGVFPGSAHENLGMSPDWADLDKFTARAIQIVQERFGIKQPPTLLPITDPRLN
ncbi:MAG TPA: hypothetical protein VHD90_23460 [Phototrophicaceae bacterium]|nr:hypothetical protein [Phototrophicaceae bacterium]